MTKMTRWMGVALTAALAVGVAQAQVKQDVKEAGHDTADATKTVAHKTAKGTKTAAKATAHGTEKVADKTVEGTKTAAKATAHGTKVAADKTADVGKATGHEVKKGAVGTRNAVRKEEGKPKVPNP